MVSSRTNKKMSSMTSVGQMTTKSIAGRILLATTLCALLSMLVVRAGGNGHVGRYGQTQQQQQQQQQQRQLNGQRPQQLPPSYTNNNNNNNVNPFLPIYSNAAPSPFGVPNPYGTPPAAQQPAATQSYPGVANGGAYLSQQRPLQQAYPNSAPAYVPIQQAYTVAYYPTYQPTTPPTPTGPYVPAPPGQRPYCANDGQTYCEEVDYYPTKLVLHLLENSDIDSFLVNDDGAATRPYGYYNITPTYFYDYSYTTNSNGQPYSPQYYPPHNRNKRQAEDDDMCPTSTSVVQARAAENAKGDWKYIVNLPEVDTKYMQTVEVTKCTTAQCVGLCTPPSGSTSRCEQQFVHTRLFSLDASGNKLNNELFRFPHCCICKITPPI